MATQSDKPLSVIALVPARSGSKRIKDKNIRPLGTHPLIAYTIAAALQSRVFSSVIVCTDSESYADIARHYGAEVPFLRPQELALEQSMDVEWVDYTLKRLGDMGRCYDCFSILRPTNPFRKSETIQRAWMEFLSDPETDSLRAVEKCKQHPGKMWLVDGARMKPLLQQDPQDPPWHSSQYAALPEVYAQNASLEIAYTRVIFDTQTIAGNEVLPFFTQGHEGFDINDPQDFWYAEDLIRCGRATLPGVEKEPFTNAVAISFQKP